MPIINQRGIAQLVLLVILVVGLGVAVWGVQFASTVLRSRASEPTQDYSNNLPNGWLGIVESDGTPTYGSP